MNKNITKQYQFCKLAIAIISCELVGIISAFFSTVAGNKWFASLSKPTWNPPGYLFGPVWTTLYLLMGISLWVIWISNNKKLQQEKSLSIFFVQLFFNFCWSIIFFRYHQIDLALFDIVILLISIIITIVSFYKINKLAAWLLLPYLLWVSFATFLNYTIWSLN